MHVLLLCAVVGEIFTSAGGGKSGNPNAAAGSNESPRGLPRGDSFYDDKYFLGFAINSL
jgi:hypothetical protein